MQTVTLEQLRATTDAGGVLGVTLKAQGSAFFVSIETRRGERLLVTTRRREPRKFIDPRKAMLILREIGIREMRVDGTQWRPEEAELEKTARPDRAVAMKQAHEAASHDKWFREQVEQGIKEADDPNTLWVSNEEAEARATERRARWSARDGTEGDA